MTQESSRMHVGCACLVVLLGLLNGIGAFGEDAITTSLESPKYEIANSQLSVWYRDDTGAWGMAARDGSTTLSDSAVVVRMGDQEVRSTEPCQRTARREDGRDDGGDYVRLEVTLTGLPNLDTLVWSATLRPNETHAVFSVSARLAAGAPRPLQAIQVANISGAPSLGFGASPDQWMQFHDSGHQAGTGVAPFFAGDQASLSSPATLLVHDGPAQQSFLMGWLSWAGSNPDLQLSGSKSEGLTSVLARCDYYAASLDQATSEPLLISFESDPLAALEHYGKEVRSVNKPPIRADTVLGWLSWYCSRLTMTEQFVLDNAAIMAEHFGAYGLDTMQVDHGWEYRDVVGNWVANERFPHGMKWLGDELTKRNTKLGIWMAVSSVSEHAPFYTEHPDALIQNAGGAPNVFIDNWYWAPHGKVFSLDPTHPAAQQHYRESFQRLMDAGCRYYKVDFIGKAGDTSGVFHDAQYPRGNPMLRHEMAQIREAIGADSWLRYCSAPSNAYCGIVNIGGATADIGNAAGNWTHLADYHQQLGSSWYKHRTFWHNEPDALIVGEGEENEARARCAWLTLSGGVVALGDDLTTIAPERMAMISKCLPSYDVAARPLDLFEHIPARIWDLPVRTPWDEYHVVGFFNVGEKEVSASVPLAKLGLGERPVVAWEFWAQSQIPQDGPDLTMTIPAHDSRLVVVRGVQHHPQVLATDMHLSMGGVELPEVKWDGESNTLSGLARRAPGEKGVIFVHLPAGYEPSEGGTLRPDGILAVPLAFKGRDTPWSVRFKSGT